MFNPAHPEYAERVRGSFERQAFMRLIGATLTRVEPGRVDITLPCRPDLAQQHGYVHAGAVGAIIDTAGGYAGYTLFPEDSSVLTVEYKLNLLAPATGTSIVAEARVVKPGRTLCIVTGEVHALQGGKRVLCAVMQQTLIVLHGQPDNPDRRT